MKRVLMGLVLLAGMTGGGVAWSEYAGAPSQRPTVQRVKGGMQTANGQVSGSAEFVTGIGIQCGSSAGVVGLYDAANLGNASNANGVWEGGCAANTSVYTSFKDVPLSFKTGVQIVMSNVTGASVMTEQQQ